MPNDTRQTLTAKKDEAPGAVQAATANVTDLGSISSGGGLIQTFSGYASIEWILTTGGGVADGPARIREPDACRSPRPGRCGAGGVSRI